MKKICLMTILSTCMLMACGDSGSKQGSWTQEDKDKALAEVRKGMATVESALSADKKQKIADCIVRKAEEGYKDLATADQDTPGMEKIGQACAMEVMLDPNSKKGSWSEADKNQLLSEMNAQRAQLDAAFGADNTELWLKCALKTTEETFKNYVEANADLKKMEQIGADCAKKVLAK